MNSLSPPFCPKAKDLEVRRPGAGDKVQGAQAESATSDAAGLLVVIGPAVQKGHFFHGGLALGWSYVLVGCLGFVVSRGRESLLGACTPIRLSAKSATTLMVLAFRSALPIMRPAGRPSVMNGSEEKKGPTSNWKARQPGKPALPKPFKPCSHASKASRPASRAT